MYFKIVFFLILIYVITIVQTAFLNSLIPPFSFYNLIILILTLVTIWGSKNTALFVAIGFGLSLEYYSILWPGVTLFTYLLIPQAATFISTYWFTKSSVLGYSGIILTVTAFYWLLRSLILAIGNWSILKIDMLIAEFINGLFVNSIISLIISLLLLKIYLEWNKRFKAI